MKRLYVGFFLFLAILTNHQVKAASPETILMNGKIVSLNDQNTNYQAIAILDGKILAIGQNSEIRKLANPSTNIIDLHGKTVIPGLIDSHMHGIRAANSYATEVQWIGAKSINEALQRLSDVAKNTPKDQWLIIAGGWTEEQFSEKRRPTQAELINAAPDHPVYVQWMYDWALITPKGYDKLKIKNESDLPGGGKFELGSDQKRTGAVLGGIVPLFDKLPKPTFGQKLIGTKKFFTELNRVGLTGIIDPAGFNMSPTEYQALFQLWRDKALTLRVNFSYFSQKKGQELAEFKEFTQLLPMGLGDDYLKFNGIGERVTFGFYNNYKPTADDTKSFYEAAKWAAEQGLTITHHWQDGKTANLILDVFEKVNQEIPIEKLRWSIAHLNDADEATFARMKKLGVGWTMQDAMYYEGDRLLKLRGPEALSKMPAIVTAQKTGVVIGAGTDAHRVANYNPFVALQWMLDGKSAAGTSLRSASEIPTRLDALKMYTLGSAWFAHAEKQRGSLEVGKFADLVVLSADYLTVPVSSIGQIYSKLTMVGGKIVYSD